MSKTFLKLSWITLVFIFLVIIAGSVVRTTGSGMGCPDWPTCFGEVVPPTSADQLPEDYQDFYSDYRKGKIEKFAKILTSIGFATEAQALLSDESLLEEAEFNAARTWTEYGNRLVGFIAGNLVLILFVWTLLRYRSNRKQVLWAFLNLILIGLNAWIGSIVVATNLVPWVLTMHMFLALVNIGVHIKIIRLARGKAYHIKMQPLFKYLFYTFLVITFVQIILGSQVRQEVDFMVKDAIDRAHWIDSMEGDFLFHRSFSWLLLLVSGALFYLDRKFKYGIPTMKWMLLLIVFEFITGVLFSYAGMPAFIQPVHLLVAAVLLAMQFFTIDFLKYSRDSMLS